MEKALLIAEKPDLMRQIEAAYTKNKAAIPIDITFVSQRGHLVTLKLPSELDEEQKTWKWENLPFHPEEHGGWQYKVIEEKKVGSYLTAKERFEIIKKELHSGKYDYVINAGDADREGELLIKIVLWKAGNKLPVKRFWSNDLTEGAIVDALQNLKDDDKDPMLCNLFAEAIARQHSDYRFGMNISEAASLKMQARIACGRVKDVILAIACKREDEINSFVPKTVYGVKSIYDKGFSGIMFDASEDAKSDENEAEKKDATIWFDTKEKAESVIKSLKKEGVVKSYEKKKVTTQPPKLFKLATLQVAADKYGLKAEDAQNAIQKLYERKLLSYPRTDCECLSSHEDFAGILAAVKTNAVFKPYIDKIDSSAIDRVKHTKKYINDEELKKHGHSALRPTTESVDMATLAPDERIVYELICRQFIAIFLPPLIQEKTTMVAEISERTFKSIGKTLVDKGFTEIFGSKIEDAVIPKMEVGDKVFVNNYEVSEKTSTCPKRFTSNTLIQACENPGKYLNDPTLAAKDLTIGTPATRASIIAQLIEKDKYLMEKKIGKKIYVVPTEIGSLIIKNLKDCKICQVDMTGEWEKKLKDVHDGKLSISEIEDFMKKEVEEMINEIKLTKMDVIGKTKYPTIATCPKCGKPVVSGPKGFFCSGYKEGCKVGAFKEICKAKISDNEFKDLLAGKEIVKVLKKDTSSWSQKLKYNLDECKIEFVKETGMKNGLLCPKCGKELTETSKTVKCECGFTLWKTICGKVLSDSQIRQLITAGKSGEIKGFTSKAGKKFNAKLKLDKDTGKIEFDFS